MDEYHQVSDAYMDTIVAKLEQLQEAREDVDVEFSVCTIHTFPWHSSYHARLHQSVDGGVELIWDTDTGRRPNPQLSTHWDLRA
jgi:hypothetical protein